MKIIAMIPARLGSNRLKKKNLLEINDKNLVEICIDKCIRSNMFDEIYLNSESEEILKFAKNKCKTYKRNEMLASSKVSGEEFLIDFLKNVECDYLFQIHTIAPLIKQEQVQNFVQDFISSKKQVGLCYDEVILETTDSSNIPINFSYDRKQNSQSLTPLKRINWAMTAWRTSDVLTEKCVSFGKDRFFYKIPSLNSKVIKTSEDYLFCKFVIEQGLL